MALIFKQKQVEETELDVTSFMNLMIVLIPVMLLSLTFTQVTVHEIKLPDLKQSAVSSEQTPSKLEVLLHENGIKVFYPSNTLIQNIPKIEIVSTAGDPDGVKQLQNMSGSADLQYDFAHLSLVLQEVKQQLTDKRDVLLLSDGAVDYQSLVSAMDAVKSYKTVIAASMVEVELFPEISLANASIK